jgi:hypothetical protein
MSIMHRPRGFFFVALVVGALLSGPLSASQVSDAEPMQNIEGLGTISFPTSTRSAAAQTAILRGALLLHMFE